MYVRGMNPDFGFFFATTTLIIAVLTAIKVYNWWTKPLLWFDPLSPFSRQLITTAEEYGAKTTVTAFEWSGANSVMHRHRAAEQLADYLRREHKKYPYSEQIVVAHSHGGNLASALDRLTTTSLPLLVTLATPFVSIVASPLKAERHETTRQVVYIASFFCGVPLIGLLGTLFGVLPGGGGFTGLLVFLVFMLIIFLFAMIVGRLLISLFGLRKNGQKVNRIVAATATTNLLEHGLLRHLVLRAIDDEASLTLAAGAIGNRLTLFFSSILMSLTGIVSSLWIIWVLVAVLLFLAGKIEFFAFVFGSEFSVFFWGIPALASIVCILLFVLSGAFKMVYGRDYCLAHYNVQ